MILFKVPTENRIHGHRKPAFAVRIVRTEHENVRAQEIDDHLSERRSLRDLDALKIAPAGYILANCLA